MAKSEPTETSDRTVYVFFYSDHDPMERARKYCECVRSSPAQSEACKVRCRLVDVLDKDAQGIEHWSGNVTIEVVGVTDGAIVNRLANPSVKCEDIHTLVVEMC